ncbi:MAG: hypothetical protein K1X86_07620 [Ignavibacteria bacterium]|nr:hypothetical protein [Ignavibacteria bacterium]
MENKDSGNFFNYICILNKYKKLIVILCLCTGIITAIFVFFVIDPIFYSSVTVKTTSKSSGVGTLFSGSGIPDIGGLGDLAGGSSSSKELGIFESIIFSRKNIEQVLIKFKLNDEWEFKYFEDAVKNFRNNVLELKKDKATGILEIGVYDKNPVRAKEIAQFIIQQLNTINIELNVQNAKNNREFIEKRYNDSKEELKIAEDSLKVYQNLYGISPDLTIKATIQSTLQLETEIKSEEVKLEVLKSMLSLDQPEIKAQAEKISILKAQLEKIENSEDKSENLRLKGAPDVAMNFLRLQRNVEIQTKILTYIVPLYEQAKIDEKKEMPSVLVIDEAFVSEKKVKPKRLTSILISIVATFLISSLFAILRDTIYLDIKKKICSSTK